MSALAIDFNFTLLQWIWHISYGMAAISILILIILVIRRSILNRKEQDFKALHNKATRHIYSVISAPIDPEKQKRKKLTDFEIKVYSVAALDILRTVKGEDSGRIISFLGKIDAPRYLTKRLKHGNRGEKIRALTLLSYWDNKDTWTALEDYSGSDDTYVQLAALRGIARYPDKKALKVLINRLSSTQSTNRLMLADVLKHFGDDAVPALGKLATNGKIAPDVRLAVVTAIKGLRSEKALPYLLKLLKSDRDSLREQAAQALGYISDMSVVDPLINALNDSVSDVRSAAARALGRISSDKALKPLAISLKDEVWWVRFYAAKAIYKIGDKGIVLLKSYAGSGGEASEIAKQVLQEMEGMAVKYV